MSDRETLLALELALARRDADAIPGGYEAVLDDAFLEIGSSGRVWTREAMLDALASAPLDDGISIEEFEVLEVREDVLLALYITVGVRPSDGATVSSRRSSLWVRDGRAFRLRFHQATPRPDPHG